MTDFNFSSRRQEEGFLANSLYKISLRRNENIQEYHGGWGSVAVSKSRYHGFDPIETDEHIAIVIGGPVLYFESNKFIGGLDRQAGTRAILERWRAGSADWSEDLSGPFVILVIDKGSARVECITDMMMFIPVYQRIEGGAVFWGTHIDALANACGAREAFDEVSLVDFVLHHAVTYPYTAYREIRQCQPGSIHCWRGGQEFNVTASTEVKFYWRPLESDIYTNLDEAAKLLRAGVQGYIGRVTESLGHVAQFISAGEDSRALAGLLPKRLKRDGYIFLDNMNREGVIAKKIAKAYELVLHIDYRDDAHYLDILPEASLLIGSGHQYTHAHTLGFDKRHDLASYRAVFGGYISDSLLKGQYARKPKWLKKFPFLPQIFMGGEDRTLEISSGLFSQQVLDEITERRRAHFAEVQAMRPESAHEWFELWPATMRIAMPNFYCNRRLFASYEVFMAKESVKMSANIPTHLKLNRRLFHSAFRPALEGSRCIFHSDGRLPYYPWWINCPIQTPIWLYQQIIKYSGIQKKNQGPWADWRNVIASPRWVDDVSRFTDGKLPHEFSATVRSGALMGNYLSISSRINLLQVCYQVQRREDESLRD